jgi:hypothetical protein
VRVGSPARARSGQLVLVTDYGDGAASGPGW